MPALGQQRRRPPAEEAGRARDEDLHRARYSATLCSYSQLRRERPRGAARRLAALGQRGDVGHGQRLGGDVVRGGLAGRRHRAVEQQPRRVRDVHGADRRAPAAVDRQRLARGGEPAELVDHGLGLRGVVLDRARPVDDPEPAVGEPEAAAAGVHAERELRVDLREVREVALLAVGRVGADLARQRAAVDVQRAAVHELRGARGGDRLGDAARAREVRLLRVVGLALGDRPARLGGEQQHAPRAAGEQPVERLAVADVGGLDARAGGARARRAARARSSRQLSASTTSSPRASASSATAAPM